MTEEEILSKIERLDAENAALKKKIALLEEKRDQPKGTYNKLIKTKQTRVKRNYDYTETKVNNSEKNNKKTWLIVVGYIAGASVILFILWETGLLIPLALIGLATSGIFKIK